MRALPPPPRLLLLLVAALAVHTAAAVCADDDARLVLAAGLPGGTACVSVVDACLLPDGLGPEARVFCPGTCGLCPPPNPCAGLPAAVVVTPDLLGLAPGAALPGPAALVALVGATQANCTRALTLAGGFAAPALPTGLLDGFPALTALTLDGLGLAALAAADLAVLGDLVALCVHPVPHARLRSCAWGGPAGRWRATRWTTWRFCATPRSGHSTWPWSCRFHAHG